MSVDDQINETLKAFDAGLVEELAQIEADFRAKYTVDDDDVDAFLSQVRARSQVRRAELVAHIRRGGAPLQ